VATQRQLRNAPLREALIDIQLEAPLPVSFAESLAERVVPGLEKKQQIRTGHFEIKVGSEAETQAVRKGYELIGCRFESEDGSKVLQVHRNGITYSILRGYRDWTEIRDATHRFWQFYLEWVRDPIIVARTAVRYVNVLELPPGSELNEYLTAAPQIPKELPQTLDNFLTRVVIPFRDDIHAIITQALEPSVPPGTNVVLDIDVFSQRKIQGASPNLWSLLDSFRAVKNAIFFSSVTERTLERYA
jgi:uncharacterized protein (TIGR04255 family)